MKNKRYPVHLHRKTYYSNAKYAISGLSGHKKYFIRFICMKAKVVRTKNSVYPTYPHYPNKKIIYPNTKNVLFECKINILSGLSTLSDYIQKIRCPSAKYGLSRLSEYNKFVIWFILMETQVIRMHRLGYPGYPLYPNVKNTLS